MRIGVWNGIPLETITAKEYNANYNAGIVDAAVGYVISDKNNYIILDGKLVAVAIDNYKRIKTLKPDNFNWKQVTGYTEPVVITERAAITTLDSKNKLDTLVAEGEAKLNTVVEEGQVKTATVRKKRRPSVRKPED